MQRFRLLSASLFASSFALHAAAQAPPGLSTNALATITLPPSSPHPATFGTDPLTFSDETNKLILPADTTSATAQAQARALAGLKQLELKTSRTKPPCYTMRSYGFTPHDLKSPHPHASTETDCTPATSAHLKPIQVHGTLVSNPATK